MMAGEEIKIKGYTPLTEKQKTLVNSNKIMEEAVLRIIDTMKKEQETPDEFDPQWMAIAKTHFQEGFMALNRSIMKPERVKFHGEE